LLIRDFLAAHDYKTLIDTLSYLKNLGVNAIELMPIMEFEGNESWGYNPSFHLAVDKYYGPKNDLKRFIDSSHANGIAVILDMVLNHAYGQSPLVRLYWDAANNRPAPNNPWFNVESPNPVFSFGNDFNHEKQVTKDFVDRVNRFWLEEYNFDGFRFDFTKGFTNTAGDGGGFDQSRINILKRMSDSIWAYDSNAYVILEHFAPNSEETILANYGMMLWGNHNCNYNQATMGYQSGPCGTWDFSGISYLNRGWSNPNLVGYMESHDEERLMFKNLQYGNSSGSYNIKNLGTALNRIKQAAAFYFLVPGPKMIWQFGELGYDVSIDDPCRVCNKPIRWGYFQEIPRLNLYKTFLYLIKLKKDYDAFRSNTFSITALGSAKRISINHPTMNVIIIGNFNVVASDINPNFQNTGWWYDYFTGDSINVTNTQENINLQPGEFRIYTTVKLPTSEPNIINEIEKTDDVIVTDFSLDQNYPNPFNPTTNIEFRIADREFVSLKVYDILGREIKTLVKEELSNGIYQVVWNGDNNLGENVSSGIYFYRIEAGEYINSRKMILIK
jgi:glycosidase